MLKRRWTIWEVPNKLDLKGNCSLEAKVAGKDKSEKENDDNQDHRHQGRHGRLAAHIVHTHLEKGNQWSSPCPILKQMQQISTWWSTLTLTREASWRPRQAELSSLVGKNSKPENKFKKSFNINQVDEPVMNVEWAPLILLIRVRL